MRMILITGCAVLLAGCISNPFGSDPPQGDNAFGHAAMVCQKAGGDSQSCLNARTVARSRCYRTMGTVDCYTSEDPFGTNDDARAFVLPIDKRRPGPSPG